MGNQPGVPRDFEALEKRRFDAVRLVREGVSQKEVARRLKVSRQTVSRWMIKRGTLGDDGLNRSPRVGRSPALTAEQREELKGLLSHSPRDFGFEGNSWTCPRVGRLIESQFGVKYHPGHVWKLLTSLGLRQRGKVGFQLKDPQKPALEK
jgi:transposase